MVRMELSTVKGHGFKVGETVEYYGMAGDDFPPAEEPTLCVLTKQGTKYVLTYAGEHGQHEWTFGPAAKIWAAKVDTVTVAPVAQGQTVHNLGTDEVFTVTEVTPATVSMRKIGTWREGVTLPARDVANMINNGTMVIIGNPGDVRAEADLVTSHDFSGHSRRPMECRLCSQPAEVHADTTDEGSSRAMWTRARKEAGMSATDAPTSVEWAMLDSNIVTVVARLNYFGRISAGSEATFLEVPEEWVTLARRARVIIEHDEWITAASEAVDMLPESVRTDAFLYFNPDHGGPATTGYVISEGDTVYRERDGHTGIVVAVNATTLDVEFFDGSERTATPVELFNAGYGAIPAAEVTDGFATAEHASEAMINAAIAAGEAYAAAESVIWAGTGTLVKPAIRTGLNRRKRKATRRNRARVGGGF